MRKEETTMIKPLKIPIAILSASLVTALACGAVKNVFAEQWTPELAKIIDGAKKEGKLRLTWGSSTLGGNEGAQMAQALMNKMFGTNIQVTYSSGPSMGRMGSKIAVEYAAGQSASSDVYLSAAPQIASLLRRQMFQTVEWQKLLPRRITSKMIEAKNTALILGTGLSGVTYNSKLTPKGEAPRTLKDFLKPEWKGKIASTPYAASFDMLAAKEIWGPEKTLDYIRKLSPQLAGLIRCGDYERLVSGEFIALVMNCSHNNALVWEEKGAPLKYMVPVDAAFKRYRHLTVPKNTTNPNAAKLFTVFMMTEEGQKLAWKTWKLDLHFFPESNMQPRVEVLEKKGVKFYEATIDFWLKHPGLGKVRKKIVKILREVKR